MRNSKATSNGEAQPRRAKGRPKGSTNASKALHEARTLAAPSHIEAVQELAALNPSMPVAKISARMNPVLWDQMRQQMMLSLLAEGYTDAVEYFRQNPKRFSPEGIEVYKTVADEINCIIEGIRRAEEAGRVFNYGHSPEDFTHCKHPHHQYDARYQHREESTQHHDDHQE